MAKRKSVYLSNENDARLKLKFSDRSDMLTEGKLNYTKAINAAIEQWFCSNNTAQNTQINNDKSN